ncbi:MAG TPA: hypothetical protein VME19_10190 [Streptosporangiaceae bacterium]|nr:hypothetical protein [Streptosporangiaceae bacterium]
MLPRSRYADLSRSGFARSSLAGPEKRIRPPSMIWAWLARPSATVANCSISRIPVPDSATAAITGIRRLTTTGARPSDSSSISRKRGWEMSPWASTTICCSPPDRVLACAASRWVSWGNNSRTRDRPACACSRDRA